MLLIPYFYKGVIYQIVNIQNRKSYIGQTTNKYPIKYIESHFKTALFTTYKYKKYFYQAIRKYKRENFKIIILGEVFGNTIKELNKNLNDAEKICIFHFRTFGSDREHYDNIYGYNMTKGGDGAGGHVVSEELRNEISKRMTGRKLSKTHSENISKGLRKSDKHKQACNSDHCREAHSKDKKGKDTWNKGLTKETDKRVEKLSHKGENNPMFGKSVYSVWVEKYGKEEADMRQEKQSRNISNKNSGENHPLYGSKFEWFTNGNENKRINLNNKDDLILLNYKKGFTRRKQGK